MLDTIVGVFREDAVASFRSVPDSAGRHVLRWTEDIIVPLPVLESCPSKHRFFGRMKCGKVGRQAAEHTLDSKNENPWHSAR